MKHNTEAKKPKQPQISSESFFRGKQDLEALAKEQGVSPVQNIADLKCDFWPKDESADDLIKAVREWRDEG